MEPPFVGRQPELAAIRRQLAAVVRDRTQKAVLVVGDPGIGKTSLLARALGGLRGLERCALIGYEPEQRIPLASARPLLRELASRPGGEALRRLVGPLGSRTGAGPDISAEPPVPIERIHVMEVAHSLVDAGAPIALTVDDLQWVDDLTIALVHYLVRAAVADRRPFALVAVARPSPAADLLASSLAGVLAPSDGLLTVELGPLDPTTSASLVHEILPSLEGREVRELAARAAGNPFWINVVTRSVAADGDPTNLVNARLRHLTADSVTLAGLLAVVARPTTVNEAATSTGWPTGRVEHAVDELVGRGLAARAGPSVHLAHDLIRDLISQTIPDRVRRDLHRTIAEGLASSAAGDLGDLTEALVHSRAAGLPSFDLALRLIRSPRRRLLGSDALALVGEIVDQESAADDRFRARIAIARLASETGVNGEAIARWTALADELPSAPGRTAAALEAARISLRLGNAELIANWRARLEHAETTDPWADVGVRAWLASVVLWRDRNISGGLALARSTLDTARTLVATAGGVEHLSSEARAAYRAAGQVAFEAATQAERFELVDSYADEAVVASAGLDAERVDALVLRGLADRTGGRYVAGAEVFRRAWEDAKRLALPVQAVPAGHWTARSLFDLGQLDEADQVSGDVARLVGRVGDATMLRGVTHVVHHELVLCRGDWRSAVADLLAEAPGLDPHYALSVYQWAAVWLARIDPDREPERIRNLVATGLHEARTAQCPRCLGELELYGLEIDVRLGDRLERLTAELGRWARRHPSPELRRGLHRRWVESLAYGTRHDVERAVDGLSAVKDESDARSFAVDAFWQQLDLAALLGGIDRRASLEAYEAAGARARAIGAPTLGGLVAQRQRALGVRAWRRTGTGSGKPGGLSPSELEVTELIASGATNPEIAAHLFLSRKTVERHVSNVLAKLGARNRVEVAARFRPPGKQGAMGESTDEPAPGDLYGQSERWKREGR